jgi:hypothetical protein
LYFKGSANERGFTPGAFLLFRGVALTHGSAGAASSGGDERQLMQHMLRQWRSIAAFMAVAFAVSGVGAPLSALAGTTGTISGTITDATSGAPVANVQVTASAPSGNRQTSTNAHGFYVLQSLIPDTYTVSFEAQGYESVSVPGVTVQQDQTTALSERFSKALKTIANVSARSSGNLVQPNQTSDVYNVSGDELNAISGGNDLHKTLYQYIQAVPGVTATGFSGQPRIHGGSVTDVQYEFDGIPIKERMTGFFTTNLSNVGIGNVEVYTGGLSAGQAASGLGVINTVVKTGTYPAFGIVSYGSAIDGSRLNDFTAEYGGATPNHRFSWYAALDKTNSLNAYASGLTYPAIMAEGGNGPGPVKTTDIIGNFHYRPNNKDDFQFLIQNGVGDFIFDYGFQRQPGQPLPVTAVPCPGYVVSTTTGSGASGGLAPNGQPCPIGLYFGTADTQNGSGNIWHHYSGIGKIQWNHILNDHSFLAFRLAENFNQYIFDQPVIDANIAALDNSPDFQTSGACTANHPAPYAPGSPIYSANPDGSGAECQQQQNWFSTGYYGDRRSEMYLGSLDYTNVISDKTTVRAGIGQEFDKNLNNSYFSFYFNPDGSWPGVNSLSSYPDHVASAYVDLSQKIGKLLFAPGLLYQRMSYDYPQHTDPTTGKITSAAGPYSVGIFNPTLSLTYTMSPKDVVRGSFTDSTSFVGTSYVYREGSALYNPGGLFSANPTLIHSYDLQFEHQFDANTSLKVGPNFNKASNIYQIVRPITSIDSTGRIHYGPAFATNAGFRQSFGAELGLSHVDHHQSGISYWLAATYDNFWANSTASLVGSYGGGSSNSLVSFPPVRNSGDPLFSGNLTADIHKNAFHLLPTIYYQGPSFYQAGQCEASASWQALSGVGTPYFACAQNSSFIAKPAHLLPELMSKGYWWANATALVHMGADQGLTLGVQVTNIFNNTNDTTPCWVTAQVNTPALAPGCAPFYPVSQTNTGTGTATNQYVYQNYSQTPTQIQVFLTKKLP